MSTGGNGDIHRDIHRIIHPPAAWRSQTCRHINPEGRWSDSDAAAQLALFEGWRVVASCPDTGRPASLSRHFVFADFNAMEPVLIRLLAIARLQDHHPDVRFGYRELTVTWNTHSAGGISDNDWICAALLDEVIETVRR